MPAEAVAFVTAAFLLERRFFLTTFGLPGILSQTAQALSALTVWPGRPSNMQKQNASVCCLLLLIVGSVPICHCDHS